MEMDDDSDRSATASSRLTLPATEMVSTSDSEPRSSRPTRRHVRSQPPKTRTERHGDVAEMRKLKITVTIDDEADVSDLTPKQVSARLTPDETVLINRLRLACAAELTAQMPPSYAKKRLIRNIGFRDTPSGYSTRYRSNSTNR